MVENKIDDIIKYVLKLYGHAVVAHMFDGGRYITFSGGGIYIYFEDDHVNCRLYNTKSRLIDHNVQYDAPELFDDVCRIIDIYLKVLYG